MAATLEGILVCFYANRWYVFSKRPLPLPPPPRLSAALSNPIIGTAIMVVAGSGLKSIIRTPSLPILFSKRGASTINHYHMMAASGDGSSSSLDSTPMDTNKLVKRLLVAGLPLETAATMTSLSSSALATALDAVAANAVTRSNFEQVHPRLGEGRERRGKEGL